MHHRDALEGADKNLLSKKFDELRKASKISREKGKKG